MTILPECGADKLYFSRYKLFLLIKWVHNDFMYVRFAGMRNTKTWSKSIYSQSSGKIGQVITSSRLYLIMASHTSSR